MYILYIDLKNSYDYHVGPIIYIDFLTEPLIKQIKITEREEN